MLPALMGSAGRGVEGVDEVVDDVGEDELVAGAVQEEPDEAAADVAGAEVDGDAAHSWLTAFRRSYSSCAEVAATSLSTSSVSEKTMAMRLRMSMWPPW